MEHKSNIMAQRSLPRGLVCSVSHLITRTMTTPIARLNRHTYLSVDNSLEIDVSEL